MLPLSEIFAPLREIFAVLFFAFSALSASAKPRARQVFAAIIVFCLRL
jgi:hypothetical protein